MQNIKELNLKMQDIKELLKNGHQVLTEIYTLENKIAEELWEDAKKYMSYCIRVYFFAIPYKGKLVGIVNGKYGYLSFGDEFLKDIRLWEERELYNYIDIYPFKRLSPEQRIELVEFFPDYINEIYNSLQKMQKELKKLEKIKDILNKVG